MPHGNLKDGFLRTVVDGQGTINAGDFNVAHDAKTGHIQQPLIFRFLLLTEQIGIASRQEGLVIGSGFLPELIIRVVVQIRHLFRIACDGAGLVEGIPVVADGRVQQQGQPYKQYEK